MLEGSPVYTQEPPTETDQLNGTELSLLRNGKDSSPTKGWIIAHNIESDRVDRRGNVAAWGRTRNGEPHTFPLELYYPFWNKKAHPALKVSSYVANLESLVEEGETRTRSAGSTAHPCDADGHPRGD